MNNPHPSLLNALRRRWLWMAFCLLMLCALSIGFLCPLLRSMNASVKSLMEVYEFPPSLWVDQPKWSNYRVALSRLPFARFMGNTVVICVAATAGQLLASPMAGFAFARLRWRGRGVWFLVLLATMMLPGQVLLIPHYLMAASIVASARWSCCSSWPSATL